MNLKRNRLTLTSISNYIIAIGGFGTNTRDIGNMEIINLEADRQWLQQNMPFSVYSHCTVALGNNIIVTGGENEDWRVRKMIFEHINKRNKMKFNFQI